MQTETFETGEPYVFLSFAGADRAIAEQVESHLTASGVRVFYDKKSIPPGAKWDQEISQALKECQSMVLLLSSSSMPSTQRKEVYDEWFPFDQMGKTIYPLLISDCELDRRFVSKNYIDARTDLQGALDGLLNVLLAKPSPGSAVKYSALTEFRQARIAEWSQPRHYLDKRFVNLTLLLDKGETDPQRWQPHPNAASFRFNDLREVLKATTDDPALVLLGAPGSGKSTLLRRLQLDHSADRLRDEAEQVSFFIQLNGYKARGNSEPPEPREWLNSQWTKLYPQLPPLESYLLKGQVLLLLDALNEMPHRSAADYHNLVGVWRAFAQEATRAGNRIVFSCRSLDYSASLSSPDLRVPQIEVQPMNPDQVREFLNAYRPAQAERIWNDLDGSPQFGLFQTPYFLKLLCEQVEASGEMPKGRASLFTGFVRQALNRESGGDLFQLQSGLLVERDHEKLTSGKWRNPFELPEWGVLVPRLSELAFAMQKKGLETEGAQVRIDYDDACDLIEHQQAENILKAGIALNVLDKDLVQFEITFFHQLLQEYFAARKLAKEPNPSLVRVEWQSEKVAEPLADTLAKLADGDPLPPLAQTGWEETTLTAAPMAKEPEAFIRALMPENLPLAARCAASAEVKISEDLKREIQQALIDRTKDKTADLRARIAAGESLGLIGDPRFQSGEGEFGKYLLPPLVKISGGKYTIGNNKSDYDFEKPASEVQLDDFQIGQFPVTNAEYKLFLEAGGYEDERWWDTPESKAWLSGEAATSGQKESWRDYRKWLQGYSEEDIYDWVARNVITSQQAEEDIETLNWTDEELEQWLNEQFPEGKTYRQPEYWDDARFNNPAQPVVGVTWFEARAYCNWLTANVTGSVPRPVGSAPGTGDQSPAETLHTGHGADSIFRLPTEAEFEAAARGKKGRQFPYGKDFDSKKCNTFESHIRRTTPVGVFDNATPEGSFDLSGNAYTWTLSIYDQDRFPYPYKHDDGREDITATGVKRVVRGGSWGGYLDFARAVYRDLDPPANRYDNLGFRVVCCRPPSS